MEAPRKPRAEGTSALPLYPSPPPPLCFSSVILYISCVVPLYCSDTSPIDSLREAQPSPRPRQLPISYGLPQSPPQVVIGGQKRVGLRFGAALRHAYLGAISFFQFLLSRGVRSPHLLWGAPPFAARLFYLPRRLIYSHCLFVELACLSYVLLLIPFPYFSELFSSGSVRVPNKLIHPSSRLLQESSPRNLPRYQEQPF